MVVLLRIHQRWREQVPISLEICYQPSLCQVKPELRHENWSHVLYNIAYCLNRLLLVLLQRVRFEEDRDHHFHVIVHELEHVIAAVLLLQHAGVQLGRSVFVLLFLLLKLCQSLCIFQLLALQRAGVYPRCLEYLLDFVITGVRVQIPILVWREKRLKRISREQLQLSRRERLRQRQEGIHILVRYFTTLAKHFYSRILLFPVRVKSEVCLQHGIQLVFPSVRC